MKWYHARLATPPRSSPWFLAVVCLAALWGGCDDAPGGSGTGDTTADNVAPDTMDPGDVAHDTAEDSTGQDVPASDTVDVGDDGPGDVIAAQPRPNSLSVTGGGGTASSAGHRITVSIGAPQPLGSAASATHRVTLGPIMR